MTSTHKRRPAHQPPSRVPEQAITATVYFAVGALVYGQLEGWSPLDTCYFLTVTATTVGYGDFAPTSPLAKLFTCGYALLGIIMIFDLIAAPVVSWLRGDWCAIRRAIRRNSGRNSLTAPPFPLQARAPPRARGVHPADERAVRAAAGRAHRERC